MQRFKKEFYRASLFLMRHYKVLFILCLLPFATIHVFAVKDMWTVANEIIKEVYTKIAGISTVLAGLMSVVAVVGAKMSSNQQKVDKSWDWLKRIWIAWAIINGIGAFIAFVVPLLEGLNTLEYAPTTTE